MEEKKVSYSFWSQQLFPKWPSNQNPAPFQGMHDSMSVTFRRCHGYHPFESNLSNLQSHVQKLIQTQAFASNHSQLQQ